MSRIRRLLTLFGLLGVIFFAAHEANAQKIEYKCASPGFVDIRFGMVFPEENKRQLADKKLTQALLDAIVEAVYQKCAATMSIAKVIAITLARTDDFGRYAGNIDNIYVHAIYDVKKRNWRSIELPNALAAVSQDALCRTIQEEQEKYRTLENQINAESNPLKKREVASNRDALYAQGKKAIQFGGFIGFTGTVAEFRDMTVLAPQFALSIIIECGVEELVRLRALFVEEGASIGFGFKEKLRTRDSNLNEFESVLSSISVRDRITFSADNVDLESELMGSPVNLEPGLLGKPVILKSGKMASPVIYVGRITHLQKH